MPRASARTGGSEKPKTSAHSVSPVETSQRPLPALTDTSKLQLQTAGKLYNIPLQPDDLNK